MKKIHVVLFLTAIITFAAGSTFGAYSGGTGEPNNPYQIANKDDLLELAATTADYNKSFILMADIDLDPNLPGGQVFTTAIIAPDTIPDPNYDFDGIPFTGTFDGSGHKITNFTVNGGSNYYLGLFGYIDSGGSVKHLGIENCSVSGSSWGVGGLVGNSYGSISNCYSTGAVSGGSNSWDVGGLVGGNYGSISNCYSTGMVSDSNWVGGLVGFNGNGGSISDCYSMGLVNGVSWVGGLVGGNGFGGSISDCYSTGAVSGSYMGVGGLAGGNGFSGSISNCYSTGAVSGDSNSEGVGGMVGYNWGGNIISSFWDTETSGQTTSAGGTGKTTAEMKQINTFANWDFAETWGIEDNQTYPFLKLTYPVGDLNHDKVVNFLDFAILAEHWLEGVEVPVPPEPNGMVWVSINEPSFTGYMSKYETTNAQYCQFLNAAKASGDIIVDGNDVIGASGPYVGQLYYNLAGSGYTYDGATNGGGARINYSGGVFSVDSGFENHPVTYVSWYGAAAFCNYYGYRLPTEWEWQAVADYDGSYIYGCGLSINNSIANYEGSTHPYGTTIVGAFGTYGYGMCDMAGNVWEWVSTIDSSFRVLRGGGWGFGDCTISNSCWCIYIPGYSDDSTGFRVCR